MVFSQEGSANSDPPFEGVRQNNEQNEIVIPEAILTQPPFPNDNDGSYPLNDFNQTFQDPTIQQAQNQVVYHQIPNHQQQNQFYLPQNQGFQSQNYPLQNSQQIHQQASHYEHYPYNQQNLSYQQVPHYQQNFMNQQNVHYQAVSYDPQYLDYQQNIDYPQSSNNPQQFYYSENQQYPQEFHQPVYSEAGFPQNSYNTTQNHDITSAPQQYYNNQVFFCGFDQGYSVNIYRDANGVHYYLNQNGEVIYMEKYNVNDSIAYTIPLKTYDGSFVEVSYTATHNHNENITYVEPNSPNIINDIDYVLYRIRCIIERYLFYLHPNLDFSPSEYVMLRYPYERPAGLPIYLFDVDDNEFQQYPSVAWLEIPYPNLHEQLPEISKHIPATSGENSVDASDDEQDGKINIVVKNITKQAKLHRRTLNNMFNVREKNYSPIEYRRNRIQNLYNEKNNFSSSMIYYSNKDQYIYSPKVESLWDINQFLESFFKDKKDFIESSYEFARKLIDKTHKSYDVSNSVIDKHFKNIQTYMNKLSNYERKHTINECYKIPDYKMILIGALKESDKLLFSLKNPYIEDYHSNSLLLNDKTKKNFFDCLFLRAKILLRAKKYTDCLFAIKEALQIEFSLELIKIKYRIYKRSLDRHIKFISIISANSRYKIYGRKTGLENYVNSNREICKLFDKCFSQISLAKYYLYSINRSFKEDKSWLFKYESLKNLAYSCGVALPLPVVEFTDQTKKPRIRTYRDIVNQVQPKENPVKNTYKLTTLGRPINGCYFDKLIFANDRPGLSPAMFRKNHWVMITPKRIFKGRSVFSERPSCAWAISDEYCHECYRFLGTRFWPCTDCHAAKFCNYRCFMLSKYGDSKLGFGQHSKVCFIYPFLKDISKEFKLAFQLLIHFKQDDFDNINHDDYTQTLEDCDTYQKFVVCSMLSRRQEALNALITVLHPEDTDRILRLATLLTSILCIRLNLSVDLHMPVSIFTTSFKLIHYFTFSPESYDFMLRLHKRDYDSRIDENRYQICSDRIISPLNDYGKNDGGVVYGSFGTLIPYSCYPNLERKYNPRTGKINYIARHVIKEGEQLTIWSGFRSYDACYSARKTMPFLLNDFSLCKSFYMQMNFNWSCSYCSPPDYSKQPAKWNGLVQCVKSFKESDQGHLQQKFSPINIENLDKIEFSDRAYYSITHQCLMARSNDNSQYFPIPRELFNLPHEEQNRNLGNEVSK